MTEPAFFFFFSLENQLIDLQRQFGFMEDSLAVLNPIVNTQSQQLADQQRQIQLLYQKTANPNQTSHIQPFDVENDRPPHY